VSASVRSNPTDTACRSEVVITRLIDAPRELVFAAWTDPARLVKWFAPHGCSIHFTSIDIRPGGSFHSCIRNPRFKDCWAIGTYREVVPPERIVFSMAVADANGQRVTAVQAGMDPEWPAETLVTVTFTADGDRTKLTLHQTVLETIAKRTGAYPSWIAMFDRLAETVLERHP
jgi:uncharacterized protein YndB with AHSA1/START domain